MTIEIATTNERTQARRIARTRRLAAEGLDLDWRPTTYWPRGESVRSTLATDDPQVSLGYGVAPGFGAGSYLPDTERAEVEIACLLLQSTLGDAISVRAKPLRNGRIEYAIVDEYSENYACRPATSSRPLSLRQLGGLLDNSGVVGSYSGESGVVWQLLDSNWDGGAHPSDLRGFITVYSEIYDELGLWYERRIDAWVREKEDWVG